MARNGRKRNVRKITLQQDRTSRCDHFNGYGHNEGIEDAERGNAGRSGIGNWTVDLSRDGVGCKIGYQALIIIVILLVCAAMIPGLVSFYYPRAAARPGHLIANEEMKAFENFLEELFSTSHNDNVKAVARIPVVFHQTRHQLDRAIGAVLRSDLAGGDWQEVMIRETKQISHLFRDAAEEMFDFLNRGRTMMKHMKNIGLPTIGKAFRDGDYATVLQVLEGMEHHIKDADTTITTARGKMRDCTEVAENVLESMRRKIHSLLKDAKEANKGWSTEGKMAVYGLTAILTVVTGAVAAPVIGVGAGLAAAGGAGAIGGGAAAMKHLSDIADGEELKRHLQSNAHNLEGAYGDMNVVRENLEQVSMDIRKLRSAVDDAETSVSGLYGQLNPEKANLFHYRLKDFAQRCSELYNLYERGIADYHNEDWRKHQALS